MSLRFPFNGSYPITQHFGDNPNYYAQFGLKGHEGIDFGLPLGTDVVSAHTGDARVVGIQLNHPAYGKVIYLDDGVDRTTYAHLQDVRSDLGMNTKVGSGEFIGRSGNSGNSSGPHLHFGLKPSDNHDSGNGYAGYINPESLFNKGDNVSKLASRDQVKSDWDGWLDNDPSDQEYSQWTNQPMEDLRGTICNILKTQRDENFMRMVETKRDNEKLVTQIGTMQDVAVQVGMQIKDLQTQINTLTVENDASQKAFTLVASERDALKTDLAKCQSGKPTTSLWDVIKSWFSKKG